MASLISAAISKSPLVLIFLTADFSKPAAALLKNLNSSLKSSPPSSKIEVISLNAADEDDEEVALEYGLTAIPSVALYYQGKLNAVQSKDVTFESIQKIINNA